MDWEFLFHLYGSACIALLIIALSSVLLHAVACILCAFIGMFHEELRSGLNGVINKLFTDLTEFVMATTFVTTGIMMFAMAMK